MRKIQREGADALLDAGVSVPLFHFRLPWRKEPVTVRVTMRRPTMAGQIEVARIWLGIGVTSEEMWKFTKEQEMEFLVKHGKDLARIMTVTLCRGRIRRLLLGRAYRWLILHRMQHEHLMGAIESFVSLMGTDPFIPIIRSAETVNPMRLRLSRERKGS